MRTPHWLAVVAGLIAFRALLGLLGPHADGYLLVGLLGAWLGVFVWRRSRARGAEYLRSLGVPDPVSPPPTQPPPPELNPPSPEAPAQVTDFVFTYPPNSRLRATLAVLFFGIFGLGFLLPLLRGSEDDPANGWLLFILGTLSLTTATLSVRQLSWTGCIIGLNATGLFHQDHKGRVTSIPWRDLRRVRTQRFPYLMIFTGVDGTRIHAYPEMIGYSTFQRLVAQTLGVG
jgi:hypothetical protein